MHEVSEIQRRRFAWVELTVGFAGAASAAVGFWTASHVLEYAAVLAAVSALSLSVARRLLVGA
jgi:hypothetical protein